MTTPAWKNWLPSFGDPVGFLQKTIPGTHGLNRSEGLKHRTANCSTYQQFENRLSKRQSWKTQNPLVNVYIYGYWKWPSRNSGCKHIKHGGSFQFVMWLFTRPGNFQEATKQETRSTDLMDPCGLSESPRVGKLLRHFLLLARCLWVYSLGLLHLWPQMVVVCINIHVFVYVM